MPATWVLPLADRAPNNPPSRAPVPPPAPGPRFADLLQRGPATHGVLARAAEPAPPDAPPPQGEDGGSQPADAAPDDVTPSQAQATARSARFGAKAAPRLREKTPPAVPAETPSPETTRSEALAQPRAADDSPTAAGTGAQHTAELRDWLAALKLPGNANTPVDADVADPSASAGTVAAQSGAPGALRAASSSIGDRTADAASSTATNTATHTATALADMPLAVASAQPGSETRTAAAEPASAHDPGLPQTLPGGAASAAAPRSFIDIGNLAPVALPTPLHSPDFAQMLGAQVSLLARDGVQQAELHLNPADMGPISVQIEIDGTQARVDFSAHAAETRELIERGLPELATALREQGLTLSGGGVFQQAPDRRNPHDGAGAGERVRGGAHRIAAGAAPGPIARPVAIAQGRLDVYA